MAKRGRESADEMLAFELAKGRTVRDAADAAGVSERTAHRRLEDAEFVSRVHRIRGEMIGTASGKLANAMSKASDRLEELVDSESEEIAFKASKALIELSVKVAETSDLAQRLSHLESELLSPIEDDDAPQQPAPPKRPHRGDVE